MNVCVHELIIKDGVNICVKCGKNGLEILRDLTYGLKEDNRYGEDFQDLGK